MNCELCIVNCALSLVRVLTVATAIVVTAALVGIASGVFTPLARWRGVGGEAALRVLDGTRVGRGQALHLVALTVVAGDDHARVLQLVLQLRGGGEHDAARGDERRLHLVHVGHRLRTQAEAHRTQSGQRTTVAP